MFGFGEGDSGKFGDFGGREYLAEVFGGSKVGRRSGIGHGSSSLVGGLIFVI